MERIRFSSYFSIQAFILFDYLHSLKNPAHIKDTQRGAYVFTNKSNLAVYNLQNENDILGKTIYDLDVFMQPNWGKQFADEVAQIDRQVYQTRQLACQKNRIFLDRAGLVRIQHMTKIPILNNRDQISALLTLVEDVAAKTELFTLLALYKQFYKKTSQAIKHFARSINIDHYFDALLTERELHCLLHMKKDSHQKWLAKKMSITLKTVETHVASIRRKSKKHGMGELLAFLRETA